MSIEENKRIASQFIEALADLSGSSCMALMSDSGTFTWMLRSKSLPLGGEVTKQVFGEVIRSMRGAFPNGVRHEIRDLLAEGDGVAIETESFAMMADGRLYNNVYHFRMTICDGKVECVKEYTDFLYAKELVFAGPEGGVRGRVPCGGDENG
jgi:ketosteroid isomerase-like protein